MIECNPRISKFFGLPKIHKENIPFRPINDYRNSVHYKLSKTLNKIISPTNEGLEFSNVKNSYQMMEHFTFKIYTFQKIAFSSLST